MPATMLIHTSYRTVIQRRLTELVETEVERLRDQWRYLRDQGIEERLRGHRRDDQRHPCGCRHNGVPFCLAEQAGDGAGVGSRVGCHPL